jgi:transcriptional regulator with XRE-family HTH domain
VPTVKKHRRLLGATIRAYRKKADMSQEKLAELADLHPVYVGNVERGEENISIDSLVGIAKAMKVRVRDLTESF